MNKSLTRPVVSALAVGGILAASLAIGVAPAGAAPGDAWPNFPAVYLGQGNFNTWLYQLTTNDDGVLEENVEYTHDGLPYNALGYHENGYLYAVTSRDGTATANNEVVPAGSLVRIGQNNVITRVGTYVADTPTSVMHAGAIIGDRLYVARTSGAMWAIDVTTGALVDTVTLSSGTGVSDFAYAGGFLWGLGNSLQNGESSIVRIDPTTGTVSRFELPQLGGLIQFGAAWTYGNGNLGFSHNATGTVVQLEITNPGAPAPDFTVISTSPGTASTNNDGAAIPGGPTDLGIVKTGTATSAPGGIVTYELDVTNHGPNDSSGFVVTDTLPATLTNVTSPDANCRVEANVVTCVGGVLLNGQSRAFTVQAQVDSSFLAGTIVNVASVLANEVDPNPVNDNDDHELVVPGTPALTVSKSVSPASRTNVQPGDVLTYTLTFLNNGSGAASVSYTDNLATLVDDAAVTAPVSDSPTVTVSPIADDEFTVTGSVPADSLPHTVTYRATVLPFDQQGDHLLANFLAETGQTPPIDPSDCAPSSTMCTLNFVPNLVVAKSSNPASGAAVLAGSEIDYTLTFTNTGSGVAAVDMIDHRAGVIDDADVTSEAAAQNRVLTLDIAAQELGISGSLAAGQSEVVTYTVRVGRDGERGDDSLANFLIERGVAVPAVCSPALQCTTHSIVGSSALPITGTAVNALLPLGALLAVMFGATLIARRSSGDRRWTRVHDRL